MSHHIHIMFTILGQVWIPIGGQAQVLLLHRPGRTGSAPGQDGSGIPQYFYSYILFSTLERCRKKGRRVKIVEERERERKEGDSFYTGSVFVR